MSNAPAHLQPRPKASPTSNVVGQITTNESAIRPLTLNQRTSTRQAPQSDALSDRATTSLIRRTLCSASTEKEVDVLELLPPLTSSNDVDLQLYALVSIVIKEFVQSWYGKITEDRIFVDETVKLVAHCTRVIETRIRTVDLDVLIFDEIPELVHAHLKIHRSAFQQLHPGPLQTEPRVIYHSLWLSPALSPVPDGNEPGTIAAQKDNEALYRQLLVDGLLAILLPTEDLENGCLTALVGQILSEMIVGNGLGGKACEPWLLWEVIIRVAELVQTQIPESDAQNQSIRTIQQGKKSDHLSSMSYTQALPFMLTTTFCTIIQYIYSTSIVLWSVIMLLRSVAKSSDRLQASTRVDYPTTMRNLVHGSEPSRTSASEALQRRPFVCMAIWSLALDLLDVVNRMPWAYGSLSLLQWTTLNGPLHVGRANGLLDNLLASQIEKLILNPALLPSILRAIRGALFPNNALGQTRLVPSLPEQLVIRGKCARALLDLVPKIGQDVFLGQDLDTRIKGVEDMLDIFGDTYCNKHLIYGIVELVAVKLFPEMANKGVHELWAEKLE